MGFRYLGIQVCEPSPLHRAIPLFLPDAHVVKIPTNVTTVPTVVVSADCHAIAAMGVPMTVLYTCSPIELRPHLWTMVMTSNQTLIAKSNTSKKANMCRAEPIDMSTIATTIPVEM